MENTLSNIKFKAKIDALNFYAEKAPNLHKRQFAHAHGTRGFPLHDPKLKEIEQLRDHPLRYMEIAVDAHTRKAVLSADRLQVLKGAYDTLAGNLYPWGGPLMVADARSFDGAKTKGITNRLPEFNGKENCAETAYYGNIDDPFQMILYFKIYDQGQLLPVDQWVVRLELKAQEEGLRHLGLNVVGDLLDLNFRTVFGKYFHCAKPVLNGMNTDCKFYRTRHLQPKLYAVVQEARRYHSQMGIDDQIGRGGMHSLHGFDSVKNNARAGYEFLNRRIREPLGRIL